MKKINFSTLVRPVFSLLAVLTVSLVSPLLLANPAAAYPAYAQAGFENPREATGRIVCAHCHLAAKPTEVEVPQAVLPDTVFKAVVKVPYDTNTQQVLGSGEKGPLNVGALLMLPDGFQLAPEDRISEEMKEEMGGIYVQNYSEAHPNWLVVGPLPGEQYQEIVFPILSPNPNDNKAINFGKYSVHVGGNRGRGQVYPTGDKTNNTLYTTAVAGTVTDVSKVDGGGYTITIAPESGAEAITENIPAGPELLVSQGQAVKAGEALTSNPNVGGFGQADTEIVLQDPNRIKWLLVFFAGVSLTQIMLVLKKKQVEKVQAAEMNF
jgi:apocytochrome f